MRLINEGCEYKGNLNDYLYFLGGKMEIVELGLYVLEDDYLDKYYIKDFPQNKKDGERPFFACFKDNKDSNIYWCIPISSQVDKYIPIIDKYPNAGEIINLYGKKYSVLLAQNIIPVHKKFIKRIFTVDGIHYKILDKNTKKRILKKCRYMRSLFMNNKHFYSEQIISLYNKMQSIE